VKMLLYEDRMKPQKMRERRRPKVGELTLQFVVLVEHAFLGGLRGRSQVLHLAVKALVVPLVAGQDHVLLPNFLLQTSKLLATDRLTLFHGRQPLKPSLRLWLSTQLLHSTKDKFTYLFTFINCSI